MRGTGKGQVRNPKFTFVFAKLVRTGIVHIIKQVALMVCLAAAQTAESD